MMLGEIFRVLKPHTRHGTEIAIYFFHYSICGTLHSVDQYLNIKLTDINVTDPDKYPHLLAVKNCFIRGSVVRYVQLPSDEVDTQLLQDAARKEIVNPR